MKAESVQISWHLSVPSFTCQPFCTDCFYFVLYVRFLKQSYRDKVNLLFNMRAQAKSPDMHCFLPNLPLKSSIMSKSWYNINIPPFMDCSSLTILTFTGLHRFFFIFTARNRNTIVFGPTLLTLLSRILVLGGVFRSAHYRFRPRLTGSGQLQRAAIRAAVVFKSWSHVLCPSSFFFLSKPHFLVLTVFTLPGETLARFLYRSGRIKCLFDFLGWGGGMLMQMRD